DVIGRQAVSGCRAFRARADRGSEGVRREIGCGRERRSHARVFHRARDGRCPLLQCEGRRGDRRGIHLLAEGRVDRSAHAHVCRGIEGVCGGDRRSRRCAAVAELHQLLPAARERGEEQDQETLVQGSHWRPPSFKMMKWTTNSTRRLASRPDCVALDSVGRDELKPLETSLSRDTPRLATYSSTASARRFESDWLWSSEPSEEACPSIATRKPLLSCSAFATSSRSGFETRSIAAWSTA